MNVRSFALSLSLSLSIILMFSGSVMAAMAKKDVGNGEIPESPDQYDELFNVTFTIPGVAGASILASTRLKSDYTVISESCLDTTGSCRQVNSTTYTLTLPAREILVVRYAD